MADVKCGGKKFMLPGMGNIQDLDVYFTVNNEKNGQNKRDNDFQILHNRQQRTVIPEE